MVLLTSLDNQNLLRALEILVVALIWLFFLRVMRAVWVEVRPPRARRAEQRAASAPPADRRARLAKMQLKVVEPEDRRGQVFELVDEMTVGRAAGCGVRVDDVYTSGIHARVFRQNGSVWVEDLGSTNGTWVNAERIGTPVKIGKGDLLQVGGTVFEVAR